MGGEKVIGYRNNVRYLGVGQFQQEGTIFVTNANVVFARQAKGYLDYNIKISLGSIAKVERPTNANGHFIDVFCKDIRTIRFAFLDNENGAQHKKDIYDMIISQAYPKFYQIFAFHHRIGENTQEQQPPTQPQPQQLHDDPTQQEGTRNDVLPSTANDNDNTDLTQNINLTNNDDGNNNDNNNKNNNNAAAVKRPRVCCPLDHVHRANSARPSPTSFVSTRAFGTSS